MAVQSGRRFTDDNFFVHGFSPMARGVATNAEAIDDNSVGKLAQADSGAPVFARLERSNRHAVQAP
jgi:hypothetical protein